MKIKIILKSVLLLVLALLSPLVAYFLIILPTRCFGFFSSCGFIFDLLILSSPFFMLGLVAWIGHRFLHLPRKHSFIIAFVLPIAGVILILFTLNRISKYEYEQLIHSAKINSKNIILHPGIAHAVDEETTQLKDEISLTYIIPFEVTSEVPSNELGYIFRPIREYDSYQFSVNEKCNSIFFYPRDEDYNPVPYIHFYPYHYYLDFQQTRTFEDILEYDFEALTEFKLSLNKDEKSTINPGRMYYIRLHAKITDPECQASDYSNSNLIDPPIRIQSL